MSIYGGGHDISTSLSLALHRDCLTFLSTFLSRVTGGGGSCDPCFTLHMINRFVIYFSVKHPWQKFPEAVEKDLGCNVYGFDPNLDHIDHYFTKNVRFFNAKLSDKDQQAQYNTPGPPGWKYRTFLTLIKELHFHDVSFKCKLQQVCCRLVSQSAAGLSPDSHRLLRLDDSNLLQVVDKLEYLDAS